MGKLYISRIRVNNFINITSYGGYGGYGYGDVPKPKPPEEYGYGYGYGYGGDLFMVTNNTNQYVPVHATNDLHNITDEFTMNPYSTSYVRGQYLHINGAWGGYYINDSDAMSWTKLVPNAENFIDTVPHYVGGHGY